ncbi:hypothetical protein [Actinoallomurus sp. NPDC052274]|uniref:hypothetical protein n=1 Tax=Actinoallomurus sp. NPDC052274 TaxID=3155420 RepID=UPI00342034F7
MDVLIRDALDADAPVIAALLTQLGYPSTTERKHLGFEDACHRSARFVRPLDTD